MQHRNYQRTALGAADDLLLIQSNPCLAYLTVCMDFQGHVHAFVCMQLPDETSDQQSKCPRDAESSSHGCTNLQEPKLLGGNTTPRPFIRSRASPQVNVYGSAVRVQTRHLASFPHSVDGEHTPDMSGCRVKIPKRTLSQSISIAEGRRGE